MKNAAGISVRFRVPDHSSMENLGSFLASFFHSGDFVYLIGDLGAGKTTLVRGIARGLGYSGRVTSPTFTLMNQYATHPPIVHLDFYRLESPDSVEDLGLEDYCNRDAVTLIEWPQIALEALPNPLMKVEIDLIDGDYTCGREVTITVDHSAKEIIERLQKYVDTCH